MRGKVTLPVNVCIAKWCENYSRCAETIKPADAPLVQYIARIPTGEWCMRFRPLEQALDTDTPVISDILSSQIGNDESQMETKEAA